MGCVLTAVLDAGGEHGLGGRKLRLMFLPHWRTIDRRAAAADVHS